jgi:hypothetical protein
MEDSLQQVATWLLEFVPQSVVDTATGAGVDGAVMDELCSTKDHESLQELGIKSKLVRIKIITRWQQQKSADSSHRVSFNVSVTATRSTPLNSSTVLYIPIDASGDYFCTSRMYSTSCTSGLYLRV